jgi:hypothetical protein
MGTAQRTGEEEGKGESFDLRECPFFSSTGMGIYSAQGGVIQQKIVIQPELPLVFAPFPRHRYHPRDPSHW